MPYRGSRLRRACERPLVCYAKPQQELKYRMHIVVTGSSGKLGRHTVKTLLEAGHTVVPADVAPPQAPPPADYPQTRIVDLSDGDRVIDLLTGADAVCHLANHPALPEPHRTAGFRNNVATTFNVFHAAERAGVKKVLYASSVQAYGVLGHREPDGSVIVASPRYLPIDEDHPLLPAAAYPLSKAAGEWFAESFARRVPEMTIWGLRFSAITEKLAPPHNHARALWSLYSAIHIADAAVAILLCCQTDRPGYTPLNIVAPGSTDNWSRQMLAETYGHTPEIRGDLQPSDALITGRRAADLIGFQPRHCREFQNA